MKNQNENLNEQDGNVNEELKILDANLIEANSNSNENQNDTNSDDNHQILVYFVLPRYGKTLQNILEEKDYKLSNSSVFHLGLQLVRILELIHSSG